MTTMAVDCLLWQGTVRRTQESSKSNKLSNSELEINSGSQSITPKQRNHSGASVDEMHRTKMLQRDSLGPPVEMHRVISAIDFKKKLDSSIQKRRPLKHTASRVWSWKAQGNLTNPGLVKQGETWTTMQDKMTNKHVFFSMATRWSDLPLSLDPHIFIFPTIFGLGAKHFYDVFTFKFHLGMSCGEDKITALRITFMAAKTKDQHGFEWKKQFFLNHCCAHHDDSGSR